MADLHRQTASFQSCGGSANPTEILDSDIDNAQMLDAGGLDGNSPSERTPSEDDTQASGSSLGGNHSQPHQHNFDNSSSITISGPAPPSLTTKTSKPTLISYIRHLHTALAHGHEAVAGFDWRSYRAQPSAAIPLTQELTGIDHQLEMERDEIQSEAYYRYLAQTPISEVRGAVRMWEDRVNKMAGFMDGVAYARGRAGLGCGEKETDEVEVEVVDDGEDDDGYGSQGLLWSIFGKIFG